MSATIVDYMQYLQSINTSATTAFSDFVHSMQHVGDEVRSGAITEAMAQKRMADFLYDQYRNFQTSASTFAERAALAGDTAAAEVWNRTANAFSGVANERALLGDAAWLRGSAALDVASSLRSLGSTLNLRVQSRQQSGHDQ